MAKRKPKIKAEIQRAKANLRAKIRRFNKKIEERQAPREYMADLSVAGIRTKKDLKKIERQFERIRKDKLEQTEGGLWLRQSDIKRIQKEIKAANRQIKADRAETQKRRKAIAKRWGRDEAPAPITKEEATIPQYKRNVQSFKTYRDLRDFESRLLQTKQRGLYGEDLKEAILKAIRGDVYQQANGWRFRGGKDNVLARFIENELTGEDVEFFFGGKLAFGYVYATEEGLLKEMEIVDELVNSGEYPDLKEVWERDYAEEWVEFMQYHLSEVPELEAEEYGADLERAEDYVKRYKDALKL